MADAWIEMPTSTKAGFVYALLDIDDFLQLNGRALSLGSHGYPQLWDRPTVKVLHRWILDLSKGCKLVGDHINHDKLDNRRRNLRVLTPSESNMNRRMRPANGEFGVYRTRYGRWSANGFWRGETHNLGNHTTQEEAVAAARAWQREVRPQAEALRPQEASA